MYRKKLLINPLERLIANMESLDELITYLNGHCIDTGSNPSKIPGESKAPTSVALLSFKIKVESDLRRVSRKIERKLGYELPDGLK
jgi:hypothetical protein